jgi:ankyrin repeat protein
MENFDTGIWVGLIIALGGTFAALFKRSPIRHSQIMKSADRDDLEMFRKLLRKKKVDINGYGVNGNRPLHLAAGKWAREGLLHDVLTKGAYIDIRNVYQQTPLHFAMFFNNPEGARILIDHGADVNVKDASGNTPLSIAEKNKKPILVDLLKNGGAQSL